MHIEEEIVKVATGDSHEIDDHSLGSEIILEHCSYAVTSVMETRVWLNHADNLRDWVEQLDTS